MAFWRDIPLSFRDALLVSKQILNTNSELLMDGVVDAEAEKLVIAAYQKVTGKEVSRMELYSKISDRYPEEAGKKIVILATERAEGKILQHLIGSQFFFEHNYEVSPEVLVPRPETEVLLESLFTELCLKNLTPRLGFEVGVGSGILSIELLCRYPDLKMIATDLSPSALEVARKNAGKILGEEKVNRLTLLLAPSPISVLEAFQNNLPGFSPDLRADFVVTNPPYLTRNDGIQKQVLEHEPHMALFAPEFDPVYFYRVLARDAPQVLQPNGFVFAEMPHERAQEIVGLFSGKGWNLKVQLDLNQRERILIAQLK